jgi:hypothetical protein
MLTWTVTKYQAKVQTTVRNPVMETLNQSGLDVSNVRGGVWFCCVIFAGQDGDVGFVLFAICGVLLHTSYVN